MPARRMNASATVMRSGVANGSAVRPRKLNCLRPGRLRGLRQDRRAIGHQGPVRLIGPIPFDHGEFRMMQRAALAVAEHAGELDDPGLARGQQLLAGEFRRGAQIKRPPASRPAPQGRSQRRADAPRCRARPAAPAVSTSRKSLGRKPAPQRRHDAAARQQRRPAVGVDVRRPPGGSFGHVLVRAAFEEIAGSRAQDRYVAPRNKAPAPKDFVP